MQAVAFTGHLITTWLPSDHPRLAGHHRVATTEVRVQEEGLLHALCGELRGFPGPWQGWEEGHEAAALSLRISR